MNEVNEFLNKRKKEIIVQTAQKLEEAGIEKSKICMEIVKNLGDRVDPSLIREALKEYPQ